MSVRLDLLAVAGAVLAATPLVARADDYFLAAGESDSITAAATYDSMTVNGEAVEGNVLADRAPGVYMVEAVM